MSGPDLFTAAAVTRAPHSVPNPTGKRGTPTAFTVYDGETVRTIIPRGRDAWALRELITAGANGCTPITHVGPRWNHYIWKLRTVYYLAIESVEEQHGGEFSGRHVRYVLRSHVRFADPADAARWRWPMSGFDWSGENVVLRAYGSIAVHENPYGDVVVRQEAGELEEDDHWVVVPVQDAELIAQAIIEKAREIKEGWSSDRPPPEQQPPEQQTRLALPAPSPRPTVTKPREGARHG